MNKTCKITLLVIASFIFANNAAFSQKIIQNESFKYIPVFQGRAVLLKEIPINDIKVSYNYARLKNWIKSIYASDIINSSILYNNSNKSVFVKSTVELILPSTNENNINKKAVMRYHLKASIINNKCVVEIYKINYKLENITPKMSKRIPAEEFVTSTAMKQKRFHQEKLETERGTLFYFNDLMESLSKALN